MAHFNNLNNIIQRILDETQSDADIEDLRQWLKNGDAQNLQLGKNIVNIGRGKDIHIGDRIYQGTDAETIREIFQSVIEKKTKQSNEIPCWKRRSLITFIFTSFFAAAGFSIFDKRNNKELAITCVRQYLKDSPTIISNLSYSLPIKQYSKFHSKRTGILTSYWKIFCLTTPIKLYL